jgi:type 1 fimbria pilin
MRRTISVMGAALALAVLVPGMASAAASSSISIGYNANTMRFHGRVTSPNSECDAGRAVKVFKDTASGRVLEGRTTTKSDGTWRVDVMHAHGHYFAVTPKQKIMTVTCDRARSRTIDVM